MLFGSEYLGTSAQSDTHCTFEQKLEVLSIIMRAWCHSGLSVINSADVTLRSVVVNTCANECYTSEMADRLSLLG
eukprot:m.3545 g.3545  ORF g.3545 m.3545 type:complete len:75 (+) comp2438_c0_seq1:28-252(+)